MPSYYTYDRSQVMDLVEDELRNIRKEIADGKDHKALYDLVKNTEGRLRALILQREEK